MSQKERKGLWGGFSKKKASKLTVSSDNSVAIIDQVHKKADLQNNHDSVVATTIAPLNQIIKNNEQSTLENVMLTVSNDEINHVNELTESKNHVAAEKNESKAANWLTRLKGKLVKTKESIGEGLFNLFQNKKIDDTLFTEIEERLLQADVGVETTEKIIAVLTAAASRKELKSAEALYTKLQQEMERMLKCVEQPLAITTPNKAPYVILMVGVNGVGKTTTIGKLAAQLQQQGKRVLLAAGDTFRAAAVEQLQAWGERNQIPVISQPTGSDSASVIFDALQAAKARNIDVVLADTAGRLQNKIHLMEELKKIIRVIKKVDANAPHEVMLVIDATTGQNGITQAKLFHQAEPITGISLTKLDGTAKGGVIFNIANQLNIPIRYLGIGEQISDLRPFVAKEFIEALFK